VLARDALLHLLCGVQMLRDWACFFTPAVWPSMCVQATAADPRSPTWKAARWRVRKPMGCSSPFGQLCLRGRHPMSRLPRCVPITVVLHTTPSHRINLIFLTPTTGVAFSKNVASSTDNIGYVIPHRVVQHFLRVRCGAAMGWSSVPAVVRASAPGIAAWWCITPASAWPCARRRWPRTGSTAGCLAGALQRRSAAACRGH
jgi:hypothetical protein